MGCRREPQRVAKRALILGAVAFRASLEITDHPRAVELSRQLLPWLRDIGCHDELDPLERELLATAYGDLSDSQRIDANWAGEAATFFSWTLSRSGPLEVTAPADQSRLPGMLSLLHPEAVGIIRSAALRDGPEIEDVCRQFVLIRSVLRERRVGPAAGEIVRRLTLQELNQCGLTVTEDAIERASRTVDGMRSVERSRAAGLYVARAHAALWLVSDGTTYFSDQTRTSQGPLTEPAG